MTNSKTTKRALLSSTLALLMCVAMLIGTTFAWFTDTASTAVNKIQSGKLDVDIVDEAGNSLDGKTLSFKNADGSADILWEPGCRYSLEKFKVVNKGNLALKYLIHITGISGSEKLNEVIDWTFDGLSDGAGELLPNDESEFITISGKMDENAGNDYQGLTIDNIAITVFATQLSSENDSIDNTYDTNASFLNTDANGNYLIANADELVFFAKSVNVDGVDYSGKTVKLTNDVDLSGIAWNAIGKVYNNYTSSSTNLFKGTFDGQNHTIKNMTVKSTASDNGCAVAGFFGGILGKVKDVKFDGAYVESVHYAGVVAAYSSANNGMVIDNCEVINSTVISKPEKVGNKYDNGDKAGGIIGYAVSGDKVQNCKVKNTTVQAYRDLGGIVGCVENADTLSGNSVENVTLVIDNANNYKNYTTDEAHNKGAIVGRVINGTLSSDNSGTATTGTIVANGVVKTNAATYEISNVAGLKWFADQVNNNSNHFINETVELTSDIDLAGIAWAPIGNDGDAIFAGTFNGNGHTIKNLKVTDSRTTADEGTTAKQKGVGFFGWLNGYVNNVKFENANVSGYHNVGVLAGYQQFGQIKDVTVVNSTVTGNHLGNAGDKDLCGDKIGGIVGVSYNVNYNDATNTYVDMINCKIKNTTVKGARDTGKIAGAAVVFDGKFAGCEATGVTLGRTENCTGANIGACLGQLVGRDI